MESKMSIGYSLSFCPGDVCVFAVLLAKESLPNRFLQRTVFLFSSTIPTTLHECVRMRSRIT